MPRIVIHRLGQRHEGEVKDGSNLVVRAGIRQFPFPHLRYGCGMGKCGKCASRVLAGGDQLLATSEVRVRRHRAYAEFAGNPTHCESLESLAGHHIEGRAQDDPR